MENRHIKWRDQCIKGAEDHGRKAWYGEAIKKIGPIGPYLLAGSLLGT